MTQTLLFTDLQTAEIVLACLSALSSLSVIITFLAFPQMRSRIFMHIIFFLSLADMIGSIAATWGYPRQGSLLCSIQSFSVSFFFKCTMLWNLALCYQLHSVVMKGVIGANMRNMHLFVWPTALFFTVISLITASYGRQGPNTTIEWCFLRDSNYELFVFWNLFDWILFAVIVNMAMFYLSFRVYNKVYGVPILQRVNPLNMVRKSLSGSVSTNESTAPDNQAGNPRIVNSPKSSSGQTIFKSLISFPVVLFFTYIPFAVANAIIFFLLPANSSVSPNYTETLILGLAQLLPLVYGLSLGLLFYLQCPEARKRWKQLLFPTPVSAAASEYIPIDFDEEQLASSMHNTSNHHSSTNYSSTNLDSYPQRSISGVSGSSAPREASSEMSFFPYITRKRQQSQSSGHESAINSKVSSNTVISAISGANSSTTLGRSMASISEHQLGDEVFGIHSNSLALENELPGRTASGVISKLTQQLHQQDL